MTEEIKEIIDYLIDEECTRRIKCITIEESKQLLDYITNLQQENETLKAKLEIGKTCGFCPYYDYKSRCEGTINLIDRTIEIIKQQPTKDDSWILSRLYGFKYSLNGSDAK